MDINLRETTNLGVEIMNSKRQVKEKLGHVVQICVCRCDVNVILNLSNTSVSSCMRVAMLRQFLPPSKELSATSAEITTLMTCHYSDLIGRAA